PIEALQVDSKEKYVYVYDKKNETVKKRKVELGIASDKYYEIKSGLKKDEKVVKNLSSQPKEGAKFYVGD
ncbi:MAG: hypothetical protein RSD42_03780, partial [Oscillospiraceae bacterium]